MNKRKFTTFITIIAFCTMAVSALPQKSGQIEQQSVTVEDFAAEGFILDIGGGGEGVIGQLKGQQVIAIETYLGSMVYEALEKLYRDKRFEKLMILEGDSGLLQQTLGRKLEGFDLISNAHELVCNLLQIPKNTFV